MDNTLFILNCNVLKDDFSVQPSSFLHIEDSYIKNIGPMEKYDEPEDARIIDGRDKLVIPGLINGHNHSAMTLFRGMADDLELSEWLHQHIFPAEAAHVSKEMVYYCSQLAAAEMLLSGTTCVADGYFFSDETAKAFDEAGLRAVVAHGVLDFPAPGVPDPSKNIDTVRQFIERWLSRSDLIRPAVFAHSPYTCSRKTLQGAKQLADEYGVRFFIHLAESKAEKEMLIEPAGESPVKHLENLGLLDENCVCVHAIWLDDEDLDFLSRSGAHAVLCPQSNFKLASGISRAAAMTSKGIPIGLGTDGCASNNTLDMFREMDIFAKSQKVFMADPTVFPARQVFSAATTANSKILGLNGPSVIQKGNRADLVLIDLKAPHLTPFYAPDLLIYSCNGRDVDTVIIDGKIVVRNRKITGFDIKRCKEKVRGFAKNLPL